jgi:hypothetical protein
VEENERRKGSEQRVSLTGRGKEEEKGKVKL